MAGSQGIGFMVELNHISLVAGIAFSKTIGTATKLLFEESRI